ncbi:MAG: 4Fe-4S dicluster domain-containing protein [Thermodesulfobacteriota bacterium]|nr:4Fe-4S dicluster domain-containing protein [Thermodesulfobacteriota bacterium]
MEWTADAESEIRKVPFFVRKKVKSRVEREAAAEGKNQVTLADVHAARKRFLANMSAEIKGYQVDTCFSRGNCPHQANTATPLADRIEERLKQADLLDFLKAAVGDSLKFHHELRVSIAECPNACSQPQIKDIGIIGACVPEITDVECSGCGECIAACRDDAIQLDEDQHIPVINTEKCLFCGACARACPTGTIADGSKAYRVMLGGKLGRHPRLAQELPGIFNENQVLDIVDRCIAFYKAASKNGQRFAELYTGPGNIDIGRE